MKEIDETMAAPNARAAEQTIRGLGYLMQELEYLREVYADAVEELDDLRAKAEEPREVTEDDLPEELRRRLMPEGMEWPKWDDGTPVLICPPICVREEDGTLREFIRIVYDGGLWFLLDRNDIPYCIGASGDRLKRPALVDHDGKPVCIGDTIYGRFDGVAWKVISINCDKPDTPVRAISEYEGVHNLTPEWFTHERPASQNSENPSQDSETSEKTVPESAEKPASASKTDENGGKGVSAERNSDGWNRLEDDLARFLQNVFKSDPSYSVRDAEDDAAVVICRAKKLAGVAE